MHSHTANRPLEILLEYFVSGSYRTTFHNGFNVADNAARILPTLIPPILSVGGISKAYVYRNDPQTVEALRVQIKAVVGTTDGNMTAGTFQCYVRFQTNIPKRSEFLSLKQFHVQKVSKYFCVCIIIPFVM